MNSLYIFFRAIHDLGIRKYLNCFWSWIELAIITLSLGCFSMYIYRHIATNKLTAVFKETPGNGYMKFQYAGYWTEMLMYVIGWLVFLATIKFLKLLRFNKKICQLAGTLRYGAKSMVWFSIMFGVLFAAFLQFFYLHYMSILEGFQTFIHTVETCLQIMLGSFDFYALRDASPVLGPLMFFLYVVSITFILLNMFLSILNEAFSTVRTDESKQPNDYEMVEFIIGRFKKLVGIDDRQTTNAIVPEDINMAEEKTDACLSPCEPAFGPLAQFPSKIDQVMDHILQLYFETHEIDDLLDGRKIMRKGTKGGAQGITSKMVHHWMKKPQPPSRNTNAPSPSCSNSGSDTKDNDSSLSLSLM